jgi:hypothetical protein
MSLFDESEVEAGHKRLASSVSVHIEALTASVDLIEKALMAENKIRTNSADHADYTAISILGYRVVNDVAAATKLLDCGYFIQAAALGRDISEVGMLALYFAENPDKLSEWRLSEEQRRKLFGRPALKSSILNTKKFEFLDEYFSLFSGFGTHPSAASIIAHHDGIQLQRFPYVNEKLYLDIHADIAFLTWHVVDAFGDAYRAFFGKEARSLFPAETDRFQSSFEGIRRSDPVE